MSTPENIHPTFGQLLGREAKETLLNQRGLVVWLYGLSGSGKSTLATALERRLHEEGVFTQVLDGDNIRTGLNNNLGFSDEDRSENIRRIAEVAKLFASAGVVTITSFICPRNELRALAREIIGQADFLEVYVECSFETCEQRDVKGLYAKAKAGQVQNFTGRDSSFEAPEPRDAADLILNTDNQAEGESLEKLYQAVHPRVVLGRGTT
ncbi:MAG: adenylyl-sulfate kinase [Verrucomicrobiota bacterium]|nr:adenylyl-sulfate kinase [Verrucomicrobiota bacterium]